MSESDTKTIIGVMCSPRPRESTYEAMSACLAAARETGGVTTRLMELAGKTVGPCLACGICKEGLTADKEGLETARNLGRRVADVVKRLAR